MKYKQIQKQIYPKLDTVDYSILPKELKMYGVKTTNLDWFASYLNDRKQYIKITEYVDTMKKYI